MESDRKSDYENGLSTSRKGARSARPRLADLLESVTVPDESPTTNLPDSSSSDASSSSAGSFNANGAPPSDFDGSTYSNGGWTSSSSPSSMDSSAGVSTSAATSAAHSDRVDHSQPVGYSQTESEWGTRNGENKVDTTAFADIDSPEDELSSAAQAAKERRRSLYSRRTDEANIRQEHKADLPSTNNGTHHSSGQSSGHSSEQSSGQGDEVGSLADRLFGDRQPSPKPTPDPSTSSTSDRMSHESATDWTARFSPDAPLPNLPNVSARTTATDQNVLSENGTPLRNSDSPGFDLSRTSNDSPNSGGLDSGGLNSGGLGSINSASARETNMKASNQPLSGQNSQLDQNNQIAQPRTRRYDTTGPSSTELADPVSIKGRSDGVSIELGQGKWSDVVEALSQRLVQSTGFFRGGQVTLDVGVRPLQESELREISALTEQHGLALTSVRSRSEQSCQVALAAGLAASLDAPDGLLAQPALSNYEKLEHFVYRGNLRSGQILRRAETILVLGDVNPGSQIISDSDILVWGRLRGIAHAGASGDTSSVITALLMEPTQIRIADAIAILPEQEVKTSITERLAGGNTSPNGTKRPEIAHSIGEDIIVDMWDESKPGGIMAFRRSL